MEKLKFTLFSIVALAIIGVIGYWSVATIQSGQEHKTNQTLKQLQEENDNLKDEVKDLKDKLSVFKVEIEEFTPEPEKEITPQIEPYKYQNLINELQKLINANIYMKLKSSGTRVGTVQRFLNVYNNTSNRVDNDYGANTKKVIIKFQKDQGLTADGEAGMNTFKEMIDWLKKQN